MTYLNFSSNFGGRIFNDYFPDVRLHEHEKFDQGTVFEIKCKNCTLGTAQVIVKKTFRFRDITDVLSHIHYNKPAHYMASVLRRYYETEHFKIQPDTLFVHIVLQYIHRDFQTLGAMMQEFYHARLEAQPQPNVHQTLFP